MRKIRSQIFEKNYNANSKGGRFQLKNEPKPKMKRIKAETHNHEKGRWSLKELLQQKETQLNQLRDQLKYKDQKLVSKELEMESYKKTAEERIFKLEAKIKELEAKLSNQPSGLPSSYGLKPFQNVQKKGGYPALREKIF